ncbi:DUF2249 domain-containing protein [Tissierella carlieri]|jgi:uncharacterized protein (DUF2249 family)|uniref:DUF2249 domain-containing protein n=1 Tax=Tissierella carlieri TaxID=689904 RepID=A0ABT1SAH0_9FIRM|nr:MULTISPECIES: DUF2249 domain-containing protein [Tissierella]MBU5313949.1 DUF2249 domain-containing protein [Tissierella carlieri]MCQ4923486.1 DUF2249 domain-containing protein [Tissierella carlieri]MDU5080317.1 DUF2249 domain-containing protein [Bacillota bacterium]OZV10352.1 hypothetical protein CIW83_20745 [Tissierella sp. P1]
MSILQIDTCGYEINDINDVVLRTFDSLPVGEKMVLINDTDPSHVFNQLEEKRFGKFEWEYIEEGPDVWKVSLAKKYLNYI